MPVERLDREKRAGGRRRSNREERSRGRHGPRPEEVRAERRQQAEPSRRQREAQSRESSSERSRHQASANSRGAGLTTRNATLRNTTFAESFRAGVERPTDAGTLELGGNLAATTPASSAEPGALPLPVAPPSMGTPLQSAAAEPLPSGPAPRPVGATTVIGARAGQIQPGVTTAPDGIAGTTRTAEGAEVSESARPEASARWAETAEAERAAAVLRQFRLQLNPTLRSATLHLSPAELGRLSIRLDVKDARVKAAVHAESPETLKILEYHLPELEAALAQQGLDVDEFELTLGFSEQGSTSREEGDRATTGANTEVTSSLDVSIDQARLARALAQRSGVDMYA